METSAASQRQFGGNRVQVQRPALSQRGHSVMIWGQALGTSKDLGTGNRQEQFEGPVAAKDIDGFCD